MKRQLGIQICVLTSGFTYVGEVELDGRFVEILNANNLRIWGTTKGLGELQSGPTPKTVADKCGVVLVPLHAVIHFIAAPGWKGKL